MKLFRRSAVLGSAVAAAAGAIAVGYAVTSRPQTAENSPPRTTTGTVAVTSGTVTQSVQIAGTLGYDGSYQVVHHGQPGTLTAAAAAGDTIGRGGVLYAVANVQTRLLFGTVPAYRDFAAGMTDGPDVRELEKNLVALKLDPSHQITVDGHFAASTTEAIR